MLNKDAVKIDTGIEGLNKMLNGGLFPGRIILVSGPAGTGKTTIGMQFIHTGLKKFDEPGVFITLEQSKEKLKEDMKKLGMDLDKLGDKFSLVGGAIAEVVYYKEKTKAKMEDFLMEIEEIIKQTDAKRVVIDSLNLFLMLFKTDEERRSALISLIELLTRHKCTTLLTCEVKENTFDLSWYGFEEFIVDGVIALYNVKVDSTFLRGLTIRKMRGMKHEKNIVPYEITDRGIVIYPEQLMFNAVKNT